MNSLYLPEHDAFIRWHQTGGLGVPAIYLPGLSLPAAASFLDVVTHPRLRDRPAVMIDYLGSGSSDHPVGFSYSLDDHAACIAAVMDHLGCGPYPVVGHSMGGSVAIALACLRPDLVSNLVIGEGNVTRGGGMATQAIANVALDEFLRVGYPQLLSDRRAKAQAGDSHASFLYGAWSKADPSGLHGNSVALVGLPDDFMARFLALNLPRSFVYGARNYPSNPKEATPDAPDPQMLKAHGVHVATVPDAGHSLMRDNLHGFVEVLQNAQ